MAERQDNRFVHRLDDICIAYNHRGHRSLNFLSPEEAVKDENEHLVTRCHTRRYREAALARKRPTFSVGEVVRIKLQGPAFNKGYHYGWSYELYRIEHIDTKFPQPMYHLRSLNNDELLEGPFYENMMQRYSTEVHKVYIKDERVVRRKKYYKVGFLGFDDPKHDEWVAEDQLAQFGLEGALLNYQQQQPPQQAPQQQQQQQQQQRQSRQQQSQLSTINEGQEGEEEEDD